MAMPEVLWAMPNDSEMAMANEETSSLAIHARRPSRLWRCRKLGSRSWILMQSWDNRKVDNIHGWMWWKDWITWGWTLICLLKRQRWWTSIMADYMLLRIMCAHHMYIRCFPIDVSIETHLDRQHTYFQRIDIQLLQMHYTRLSKLWEETRYCERGECRERTGLQYWKVNLVDWYACSKDQVLYVNKCWEKQDAVHLSGGMCTSTRA